MTTGRINQVAIPHSKPGRDSHFAPIEESPPRSELRRVPTRAGLPLSRESGKGDKQGNGSGTQGNGCCGTNSEGRRVGFRPRPPGGKISPFLPPSVPSRPFPPDRTKHRPPFRGARPRDPPDPPRVGRGDLESCGEDESPPPHALVCPAQSRTLRVTVGRRARLASREPKTQTL